MKKLKVILGLVMLMMPMIIMAANTNPLGDAQNATTGAGNLIATLLVIVIVSIWTLPMIFGFMVYHGQKKKAEQQHEEVGMKAAGIALIAAIMGVAASYYIVGSIGKATDPTVATLADGNSVFLKPILGQGVLNITGGSGLSTDAAGEMGTYDGK